GAVTDRVLGRFGPDGEFFLPPFVGTCLLRLANGATRRVERGAEPAPRKRAATRAVGGRRSPRVARLVLLHAGARLSAAGPARRGQASHRPRAGILLVPTRAH